MKWTFGRTNAAPGKWMAASIIIAAGTFFAAVVHAETPALGSPESRITQQEIEAGMALLDVRTAGLKVFSTPFNHLDGFGDGPMDPQNPGSFVPHHVNLNVHAPGHQGLNPIHWLVALIKTSLFCIRTVCTAHQAADP